MAGCAAETEGLRRGTDDGHALPQRGGDAGGLRAQGAGRAWREHGIDGEVVDRRQRQHRRLAGASPRDAGARVVHVAEQGLRQRAAWAASRPPAAATSSWATPTTATTSPTSSRSSSELRDGRRPGDGQPLQGRHRARAPCRSLHRYLGNPVLSLHRPAVLPQRRSATSTAACAASAATRSCDARPADARAWSSPARWSSRRRWPS